MPEAGSKVRLLDIVIVTYRCYTELERCLESIKIAGDMCLVGSCIVVDNSPLQGYWDNVATQPPPVTVIENRRNEGFAKAANQGIERGGAPYVLLLNPDSTVASGAFRKAVDYLEQNPEVAVLGPKILEKDGRIQGSARAFPSVSTFFFGRSSVLTHLFPHNRFVQKNMPCFGRNPKNNGGIPVDWVSGAAMFLRRDALAEVGLFDERFFMYWEDADLCQRMSRAGWEVIYYPVPTVVHLTGRSSQHHRLRCQMDFYKSAFLFVKKRDQGGVPLRSILVAHALALHMLFRLCSIIYGGSR